MRFYELLNTRVETESGERLGHVHDVCGELRGSRLVVTGLLVGLGGLREHYGLLFGPRAGGGKRRLGGPFVPWEAVVRLTGDKVVVRDGTQ